MKYAKQFQKAGWKLAVLGVGAAASLYPLASAHSADGPASATVGAATQNADDATPPGGGFGGHGSQRHVAQGFNGRGHSGQNGGPPPSPEEMMAAQLDLSADQQAQVKALFASEREQIDAIRAQTRTKLLALLTAQQREQLAQMRPQHHGGPQGNNAQHGDRQGRQNGGPQDQSFSPPPSHGGEEMDGDQDAPPPAPHGDGHDND